MLLLRDVGSMATSFCCSVSGLSCPVTGAHHGARRPGVMATAISLGKPEQVSQTDRNNHFPWPAYNNSLLQPRISLVFIAARPHCCSTFTCHALTIAKVTTGWLVMLPVLHATAQNTILGNEGQVLWQHCTPERTEPGTGLISKTTSKTPGLRRMALNRYFRFPCHESACRKMKKYKGL